MLNLAGHVVGINTNAVCDGHVVALRSEEVTLEIKKLRDALAQCKEGPKVEGKPS